MNKKQQLMKATRFYNPETAILRLEFALPYSNGNLAEIILVPGLFIFDKLAYIEQAYDDELVMKRNSEVKILNFYLAD